MKDQRQLAIKRIIEEKRVETQDDLARELKEQGYKVTQATISRDIKDLHLIKVQCETGAYKYAFNEAVGAPNVERMQRVFKDMVKLVQSAGNLVVISTITGSAGAVAEVVDNLEIEGVVGTIAGDNTIFVATKDEVSAHLAAQKLGQYMR